MKNRMNRGLYLSIIVIALIMSTTIQVKAEDVKNVKYKYDELGRVIQKIYTDGITVIYKYDKNGNLIKIEKSLLDTEKTNGSTEADGINNDMQKSEEDITEKAMGETTEKGTEETTEKATEETTEKATKETTEKATEETTAVDNELYTDYKDELKGYISFKAKCPVIKSVVRTKKKRYLRIVIRQPAGNAALKELGYQVRYADNKKFKGFKVFSVKRSLSGKYTSFTYKERRLVKKKTYYVKVRAYIRTWTGKTIYSRYSKVKKIKNN